MMLRYPDHLSYIAGIRFIQSFIKKKITMGPPHMVSRHFGGQREILIKLLMQTINLSVLCLLCSLCFLFVCLFTCFNY